MITTQTELDVSPGGIPPTIHVSQYDTGSRTLLLNLISGAGDLILPTGTRAEIRGTKPDGNGFSYDCALNGKTAEVSVTEQMTAGGSFSHGADDGGRRKGGLRDRALHRHAAAGRLRAVRGLHAALYRQFLSDY